MEPYSSLYIVSLNIYKKEAVKWLGMHQEEIAFAISTPRANDGSFRIVFY